MSNITTRNASSAVASLQSLKSGLQNVQHSLPPTGGDALLRMLKDGGWVYGAENIEVEDRSLWAVNPLSISHGYACWTNYSPGEKKKNELLGEAMVGMTQPKPNKAELSDYGWDWKDQVSFDLVCLSGEDKGEQTHYKTTSVGGIRAVHELIDKIMKQLDVAADKPVPVIELLSDHYDHRSYGKTYVPVFQVKQWSEMSDEAPDVGDEDDTDEAPQTKAPAKAAETTAAAPAKRRRGAAAETAAAAPAEDTDQPETGTPAAPRRRRRAA